MISKSFQQKNSTKENRLNSRMLHKNTRSKTPKRTYEKSAKVPNKTLVSRQANKNENRPPLKSKTISIFYLLKKYRTLPEFITKKAKIRPSPAYKNRVDNTKGV